MNSYLDSHIFWGIHSPFSALTGIGLLITASGRVTQALVCAFSLVWIGIFTMITAGLGRKYLPPKMEESVLVFIAALGSGIFYLVLSLIEPVLAMESGFIIALSPAYIISSGLYRRVREYDPLEMFSQALVEALVLGLLVLGLSLIREPLGYGALSLPVAGMIRFSGEEPLRILQVSSGTLILFGYGMALYRYFRNQYTNSEDD
jgi:hypothetical protein